MIKIVMLVLLLTSICGNLIAQVNQSATGWAAYFNSIKIGDKYTLINDLQFRSNADYQKMQTLLPRISLNRNLAGGKQAGIGYAHILNKTGNPNETEYVAEKRIFQQFIISQQIKNTLLSHRFRLEERFLPVTTLNGTGSSKVTDHKYNTRVRYFTRWIKPINNKQAGFSSGWFTGVQNEIFINATHFKNVNGKIFDQNRLYGFFGYRLSKKTDFELGYMNQFIKTNASKDQMNHIAQIAIYNRF